MRGQTGDANAGNPPANRRGLSGSAVLGAILIALGLVIVILGINASGALGAASLAPLANLVPNQTMLFILGGIGLLVAGSLWAYFGGPGREKILRS